MEEYRAEAISEVVLTYRQGDAPPEEVVLSLTRELPPSMQSAPEKDEDLFLELFDDRRGPRVPNIRPSAVNPPERKRGNWGARLFVGLSLLVAVICLGVGIWYVGLYGWALPGSAPADVPDQRQDDPDRPHRDDPYYYPEEDWADARETTIARYPTGGEARLTLATARDLAVLTPEEIYTKVTPSTVTVLGDQGSYSSVGTGVIFTEDGYILTNCHVIAGCSACMVWITDQYDVVSEFPARLVGYDADVDLAVLKITAQDLPAAQFGVSDDLQVGQPAYAIGNPLGIDLRNTMTSGTVSAINRDVDVDGVTMTLIQTDAALNSGNSGGPLINRYGQVIGINTIKMMSDDDTIEGLGFAIPSSLALRWVNELIEFGELQPQPVLGVTINKIPEALPDGQLGLRVAEIVRGGSSDRAGLQVGDYIVSFNGQQVTTIQQILNIRRDLYVGDQVPVRVWRNDGYLELTMTMRAE